MAEFSTTSDAHLHSKKRARSPSHASISCPSLTQHEGIRASKRLRTNSSKALEIPEANPPSPEVVYERRRVNPESLAIRLGPELVGELNALIIPGNRDMPSFAVRRSYKSATTSIADTFMTISTAKVCELSKRTSTEILSDRRINQLQSHR